MKKTGMAKSDAKKLMGKMAAPGAAGFGNGDVVAVDRREQRKREKDANPGAPGTPGEDPDIAGIVPGPQPLPED